MLKHDRSTFFLKSIFRIGTEHLILFGRHVFTDVFWLSKLLALLNYLCVSSISRSATPDTFRDSVKTFADIAIYASVSNCVFGQ